MSWLDRFVLGAVFLMCAAMAVGGLWLSRTSECVRYTTSTTFVAGTPVTSLQADAGCPQ